MKEVAMGIDSGGTGKKLALSQKKEMVGYGLILKHQLYSGNNYLANLSSAAGLIRYLSDHPLSIGTIPTMN